MADAPANEPLPVIGRRQVARDTHGWVRGIRWALGRGGAHCRTDEHAASDYADAKGARRCGTCTRPGAAGPQNGGAA